MIDLRALDGTTWLMEPRRLHQAVMRVARIPTCPTARELATYRRERLDAFAALSSQAIAGSGIETPEMEQAAPAKQVRAVKGKVGIIPVFGPVEQRQSAELMKMGGTSTEEIGTALDAMLADKSIGAIVMQFDSPGGTSYGMEEMSTKIFNSRGQKPLYAMADPMAASAAYWLATAADMLVVTPSGDVGSVGTYSIHVDESAALAEEGIKVTLAKAGKYKAEFASFLELSKDAADHMQSEVERTNERFIAGLARNRNVSKDTVRRTYGEGRLVSAQDAVDKGLADRVMSFDELLGRLLGAPASGSGGKQNASMEVMRLREHWRRKKLSA